VGLERRDVVGRRRTAGECGAADFQAVMLDRVENAQAGVTGVARQQDHLDRRHVAGQLVEAQQLLHQRERHAGSQDVLLVLDLERAVGVEAVALEQRVAVAEVEQRARGDGDDQAVVGGGYGIVDGWLAHAANLPQRARSECRGVRSESEQQRSRPSLTSHSSPLTSHSAANCSSRMRCSRLCSGSNSRRTPRPSAWRTTTSRTSRTSWKSAVALTGRLPGSRMRSVTWVRCGRIAPRQRRGRNGLIGVSASTFASSGRIGPCADRLYAVEPAGVATMMPSQTRLGSLTVSLSFTSRCAAWLLWRSRDTSLNACARWLVPS